MTDEDDDEAAYLRQEQARFRFFKKIEDEQQDRGGTAPNERG
jgi:hypothetical protein